MLHACGGRGGGGGKKVVSKTLHAVAGGGRGGGGTQWTGASSSELFGDGLQGLITYVSYFILII